VLAAGLALLKIALPILLVVWVIRWFMAGRNGKHEGSEPGPTSDAPPGTDPA
jgi:hypothetical protein